jgi:hypothetical protein
VTNANANANASKAARIKAVRNATVAHVIAAKRANAVVNYKITYKQP